MGQAILVDDAAICASDLSAKIDAVWNLDKILEVEMFIDSRRQIRGWGSRNDECHKGYLCLPRLEGRCCLTSQLQ